MGDFNSRLIAALGKMQNPKKDMTAKGAKFSYDYATLDQVLNIVKEALKENGLAVSQGVRIEQSYGETMFILETKVFGDDECVVLDTRPYKVFSDPQQQGSWETYNRRYAALMAFGLAGEDDDDGASAKPAPQSQSKPSEPPATPPRCFIEFTALKNRLVAAGMDATAAGNLLKKELGDPRSMDEEQYRSAIANGDVLVRSYESNVNQ